MKPLLLRLLLLVLLPCVLSAREPREQKRIDYLLQSIESLNGAAFIRNGSEYGPADAGKHLRLKLQNAGERVKTAEDFIEGCASRSSLSSKPYQIRLADGTTTETAPFFRAKLRDFDHAQK